MIGNDGARPLDGEKWIERTAQNQNQKGGSCIIESTGCRNPRSTHEHCGGHAGVAVLATVSQAEGREGTRRARALRPQPQSGGGAHPECEAGTWLWPYRCPAGSHSGPLAVLSGRMGSADRLGTKTVWSHEGTCVSGSGASTCHTCLDTAPL